MVRTRQSVSKITFPSMTFCPFLDYPIGFSKNLTEYYENLPPLKETVLYGIQGLDTSSPEHEVHWNSAPEFSFYPTIVDEVNIISY